MPALEQTTKEPILYRDIAFIVHVPKNVSAYTKSPIETSTLSMGIEASDVVLSLIVLVGLLGNTVALVAIFRSKLRRMAANQYLIVLTSSDSAFLLGLIPLILKVDFISYRWCVLVEYVLMSASYISSWTVTALTVERYVAIQHPLRHKQASDAQRYSHISRTKIMLVCSVLSLVLNLSQLAILTPAEGITLDKRKCTVGDGRVKMLAEFLDVLLCYVVPCVVVVTLNVVVAIGARSRDKRLLAECQISSLRRSGKSTNTLLNKGDAPTPSSSSNTRLLLIVPIVYVVLNSPFYLLRIIDTIAVNIFEDRTFSLASESMDAHLGALVNFIHYLYYVNFAIDFLVYTFSSSHFWKNVVQVWRELLCLATDDRTTATSPSGPRYSSNVVTSSVSSRNNSRT